MHEYRWRSSQMTAFPNTDTARSASMASEPHDQPNHERCEPVPCHE